LANIKQFGEFVTPTGQKGNIFNLSSWASMIIGVMVFLVAFAMGQNFTAKLGRLAPIDTTIDPIVKQPTTSGKVYL